MANSVFRVCDIHEQQIANCFMVIVICQTGIGAFFSVDGSSILWSCALVAGSGCVRACSEEKQTLGNGEFYFVHNPVIWWSKARSNKTCYSSVTCYTSSDFFIQEFCRCSSTTFLNEDADSFSCVLLCVDKMWERRKDWVYIRADVLCMLVCMWVRVSFLQKKLDTSPAPSPDRCEVSFLCWLKLSFIKC